MKMNTQAGIRCDKGRERFQENISRLDTPALSVRIALAALLLSFTGVSSVQPVKATSPQQTPAQSLLVQAPAEPESPKEEKPVRPVLEDNLEQSALIRDRVQNEVDRAFNRTAGSLNALLVMLALFPTLAALGIWQLLEKLQQQTQICRQEIESLKADVITDIKAIVSEVQPVLKQLKQQTDIAEQTLASFSTAATDSMNTLVTGSHHDTLTHNSVLRVNELKSPATPPEMLSAVDCVKQGNALFFEGRFQEAIAVYDKALQLKDDYYQAWSNRGSALFNLHRHEEALASYNKALKIEPNYLEAWNNRGNVLSGLRRHEEALASYNKAIDLKPDRPESWHHRAQALMELSRCEEAIHSYNRALELKPDYAEAWNQRGKTLEKLHRYEEAVKSYEKAVQFKPDDPEIWNNRGNAMTSLSRYPEAISCYDKAVQLKPDYYQAWSNRGSAFAKWNRHEDAIASYHAALKLKPDSPDVWYNKACCYASQGHVELAIENLQQAISLNPGEYKQLAKTDSDFDAVRDREIFKQLIDA